MTALPAYHRDAAALSPLQKLRFFPQTVSRGAGCHLTDETGRALLDFSASWGAASLGYAHPTWVAAITQAAQEQAGASVLSTANAPATTLAERLLGLTPGTGDRRVWLGHSGSDANETVARAVTAATGRPRILAFDGAYHGGTAGSMAVSGHPVQGDGARSAHLTLLPYPDPDRPFAGDVTGQALLTHIAELLHTEVPGHEVAAFFIEPIQSDGGLILPPPGFFAALARICADHGILTVCDEVKVGLGRTGLLHCFEHQGFTPDIVTFGKGLGGGLPISAVVGPAHVLDHATAFSMQTTHGNPICASAALAVLDTITGQDLPARAVTTGATLMAALQDALAPHASRIRLRGRGLAIGVELLTPDGAPDPDWTRASVYRAWELGLIAYYVGARSNVIELTPPLILTPDQARHGAALLARAITQAAEGQVPAAQLAEFQGW